MYTGHKNTKMPDGQTLVDWVLPTIHDEARRFDVTMPDKKQVALVISSLRMHSIIAHAAAYDTSELGQPDKVTEFWPIESSVGRYLRDAADEVLRDDS